MSKLVNSKFNKIFFFLTNNMFSYFFCVGGTWCRRCRCLWGWVSGHSPPTILPLTWDVAGWLVTGGCVRIAVGWVTLVTLLRVVLLLEIERCRWVVWVAAGGLVLEGETLSVLFIGGALDFCCFFYRTKSFVGQIRIMSIIMSEKNVSPKKFIISDQHFFLLLLFLIFEL